MATNEQIEKQPVVTNEQRWRDSFGKRHADIDMNDPEAYYGAINDDYADYDSKSKRLEGLEEEVEKIKQMLDENPMLYDILYAIHNGENWVQTLASIAGPSFAELLKNPSDDELAKQVLDGINTHNENVKTGRQIEQERDENAEAALTAMLEVMQERGLDDSEKEEMFNMFKEMNEGAYVYKFSKEMWERLADAVTHDRDVETAGAEGEMRGRNGRMAVERRRRRQGASPEAMRGQGGNIAERRNSLLDMSDMGDWTANDIYEDR